MATRPTERARAKARRQQALLREAARLFAQRGYAAVTLEDLGSAAGVSGPAVYRHFPSKRALLGALLVGVSQRLLAGGQSVLAGTSDVDERLDGLIRFHVAFALDDADIIRTQDRDLDNCEERDRHRVRSLQRAYVELWVQVLHDMHPSRPLPDLRVRAHAVFGLINSTPHSVQGLRGAPPEAEVRAVLEQLARAALTA